MPIKPIVLQRRHAELGRIRLGYQAPTERGGTRPAKLETFRFTSVSERYIRDLAELYGGDPKPWDNGGIKSWEVYTQAKSIPVIAVKGGLSQWMEFWQGGGCVHRCDGEINVLTGDACDLDEKVTMRVRGKDVQVNPHTEAKPTTRLSLMLPELEAIGVWRCETHGWNAAAEIPAVAELAQYVGDLVPAHLHLQERRSVKDGKTSRFVVPVLDLQIGTARLREIVAEKSGTAAPALEAPSPKAPELEAPSAPTADSEWAYWLAAVAEAKHRGDLASIWTRMVEKNLIGSHAPATPESVEFIDTWKARAHQVPEAPAAAPAEPDADGVVDAEFTEDPLADNSDQVWQQILAAGGQQGMSLGDVEDDFAAKMGGLSSADASAAELQHYLGLLTGERAA
jgi:hypothetical protein